MASCNGPASVSLLIICSTAMIVIRDATQALKALFHRLFLSLSATAVYATVAYYDPRVRFCIYC